VSRSLVTNVTPNHGALAPAPVASGGALYHRLIHMSQGHGFQRRYVLAQLVALIALLVGCEGTPSITYQTAVPNAAASSRNFDTESAGAPARSEVFSGTWIVRAEADAPSRPNALCQTANAEFPAIILDSTVYGDVTVTVRFKPLSGNVDQAAGLIARVQDKGNYYILRANVLETNVNLYKYAGGRRSGMKDGGATVAHARWQELRFEVVGDVLRGFLDGKLVVETRDATYKAGRIGLWTKADSVTCFDDLVIAPGTR
jgi:hypothetical protein